MPSKIELEMRIKEPKALFGQKLLLTWEGEAETSIT